MKKMELKDGFYKTTNVFSDEDAFALKMKNIHPKLFGLFCPVKYELVKKEKVYVPYEFMVFDYKLKRGARKDGALGKTELFDREGKVALVLDLNEVHAFHFDLFDDLGLQKHSGGSLKGRLLKPNCTREEALAKGVECVKWQYLRKVFHAIPQISLIERQCFFREAWKLTLVSKEKTFEKFAYLDKFGAENEHVSGLKVRLTTT